MPKKAPRDAGEEFIQGILEKIPEDKREQAKALLFGDEILTFAGEHALRQDEFSRGMDELTDAKKKVKARHDQLDRWWEENSAALKEYPTLKEQLEKLQANPKGGGDEGDPAVDNDLKAALNNMITKDDGAKQLANAIHTSEGRVLDLLTQIGPLQHGHVKDFDEPIDIGGLVKFAVDNKLPDIKTAYPMFYREKLAQKEEAAKKKHEEELRASIRKEVEEEARKNGSPYPIPRGEGAVSTLSGLSTKDAARPGVKAAIDEYYRQGQ